MNGRELNGRIGGLTTASRYPGKDITAAARRGWDARWEREVDPEGTLAPAERTRRAEAAKRAHMAKLARLSAQKRAAGKQ